MKQNAALRAVARCPIDTNLHRLYDELKIDNLTVARQKSTIKMVFRGYKDQGPPRLNHMFQNYIPSRNLRSENSMLILPPPRKLKMSERDIAVRGCQYWNPVPMETKACQDLKVLKTKLKPYGIAAIRNS